MKFEKKAILRKKQPTREEAEEAVRTLLLWVGEDPDREGLIETPARVVRAYKELFSGYGESVERILGTSFGEVAGYKQSILVKNIQFFSHCEHHMVPIIGKAHVAYFPDKKVVGLSKISRIVEVFSRRLQTQESMTAQIADALIRHLKSVGVAVFIEAEHFCMTMRGVQKQASSTITMAFEGTYKDEQAQARFISMVRRSS
ncbi:MAG: GTP cyclohydrolase I [Candidatus Tokpelaia sp. JSC161]|jgi:GTP cyclohydrolase I|nr:MAG: GTP cyclohydrolase I [Candidatus Tokpelaia sp. JSC161]